MSPRRQLSDEIAGERASRSTNRPAFKSVGWERTRNRVRIHHTSGSPVLEGRKLATSAFWGPHNKCDAEPVVSAATALPLDRARWHPPQQIMKAPTTSCSRLCSRRFTSADRGSRTTLAATIARPPGCTHPSSRQYVSTGTSCFREVVR